MRLRLFVLIAICVVLDVLVARQVRQYDEQKVAIRTEHAADDAEEAIALKDKRESGQIDIA